MIQNRDICPPRRNDPGNHIYSKGSFKPTGESALGTLEFAR